MEVLGADCLGWTGENCCIKDTLHLERHWSSSAVDFPILDLVPAMR